MLRRLALVVALLGPAAALAQTAGQVVITPSALGTANCASTTTAVTLTWTSSSTQTIVSGDVYKIFLSTGSISCSSANPGPGQFRTDIPASTLTQTYPGAGDAALYAGEFVTGAGASCSTNATINVCVQQIGTASTTPKGFATGTVKLEVLPPPVPVSVVVTPGDSALFVSWLDGTSNGVTAASYNVTAVGGGVTVPKNTTSKSYRLDGLTNGTTYGVTVASVSAGGNVSAATNAVYGTPQPVDDFWDQYVKAQGREQGGCSGGPAGALSLLGVALALRMLRRRS